LKPAQLLFVIYLTYTWESCLICPIISGIRELANFAFSHSPAPCRKAVAVPVTNKERHLDFVVLSHVPDEQIKLRANSKHPLFSHLNKLSILCHPCISRAASKSKERGCPRCKRRLTCSQFLLDYQRAFQRALVRRLFKDMLVPENRS
jgi:hypothetical protein